ncbi:competence protein CoiA family protein [Paraburkholderia sp. J67]|uniref:competence protein CoiA family protein n=1 Tax=Paraburkholderia sp. J67 TaxID=2805435 RepID=UPI002ABD9242|nr:competence protein CoiA family protein [Paraburkholderia sp. J67]
MKIPFALDETERIVEIREVPPSVEGTFRCAACGEPVTPKQGEVRIWHFAHRPESGRTTAFETALHVLAKQFLVESDTLCVPGLVCQLDARAGGEDITLCVEHTLHWDAVGEAEVWVEGIRPDFRGVCEGRAIFVEVTVTHEVDAPKRETLKRLGAPTLEIDQSAVPRNVTAPELRRRVLDAIEGKRWVFYPGEAEAWAQLNALRQQSDAVSRAASHAVVDQQRQGQRRQEAALNAARADTQAERLRMIASANAAFRSATSERQLAFLEQKLGKPVTTWPASIGQDVRGAEAIPASTRIWQADVFRRYIHGRGARYHPRVSVEPVADWLVQRYAIASTELTSVRDAVWNFLSALGRAGYLRRGERLEFDIIRDVLGDDAVLRSQAMSLGGRPARMRLSRRPRM